MNSLKSLTRSMILTGLTIAGLQFAMLAPPACAQQQDDGGNGKKGKTEKPAPAPAYTGPKKRIAVMSPDEPGNTAPNGEWVKAMKLSYGIKDADDAGLKLNSMLTTALQNTGRFVIVERQHFNDIRSEQDLAKEGQTTAQTGAKKGTILGAQQMIRCTVTEFADDSVKEGGGAGIKIGSVQLGGGGARKKAKIVVDVRIFDVATSKVLYTSSAAGNSESRGGGGGVSFLGQSAVFGKSTNDPIEKATREAITNAVDFIIGKMEDVPWEGKIALVDKDDDGKDFYVLNRGEADGLRVGDRLMVTSPGKEIIDPDTGEKLGRSKDKVLGGCKVVWTDKNIAHVEPDSGVVITQGSVLKFK